MGSSKSSSQANQTSNSTNIDNRIANGPGGLVLKDSGGATVNITDAGIVQNALFSVDRSLGSVDSAVGAALKTVQMSDATNADGFGKLLNLADKLIGETSATGERLIAQTNNSVMDAYRNAKTDATGAIDQKTIVVIVLAAAAVGGAYVFRKK